VSIANVRRIIGSALHPDFNPIGSSQFEVSFDDRAGEVVYLPKGFAFAIVKVGLPMPWRMSIGARGTEDEELRVRRPLRLLNIAPVLAIRRLKVLGRQEGACRVTNLSAGFVEWGARMSSDR
jgi:hypothetical protein